MRTFLFFSLMLLFAYPFVLSPTLLAFWAKRRRRPAEVPAMGELPRIALVICAFNERQIIRQKIENSLKLEYPPDKLTIVVVSDGSTDGTADVVRTLQSARVVFLDHEVRRGKVANLNDVIPTRQEQIIVLSDANVMYDQQALIRLAARFSDASVGCVSGKVVLTDTVPELEWPTGRYYAVEWRMQEAASAVYSMVGADGAMYALRRDLFRPCPSDTLIEDFVIPMHVIAQGRRVVFEPKALGWEKGVSSLREEFRRKVRIGAGVAQGLIRGNVWPSNAPMRFWFIFISYKLLRWLSPVTGAFLAVAALLWPDDPAAWVLKTGFIVITALTLVRAVTGWRHVLVNAPFYFFFGQVALLVGLVKGMAGQQTVLWAKVNR